MGFQRPAVPQPLRQQAPRPHLAQRLALAQPLLLPRGVVPLAVYALPNLRSVTLQHPFRESHLAVGDG